MPTTGTAKRVPCSASSAGPTGCSESARRTSTSLTIRSPPSPARATSRSPSNSRCSKVAGESSTEGNLRPDVDLNGWADSFVHPTLVASERGEARESLLRILRDSTPGEDPFGREDIEDLLDPPPEVAHLLSALHLDIFDTMFTLLPDCRAAPKTIEGYRALSVSTLSLTRKRFSAFESIVDPCAWPGCWLQAWFFKHMNFVRPPQGPGLGIPAPEDGWEATLEEVVDWSLGFGPPDEMKTHLDFRYVWPKQGAGAEQFKRGACTYDLAYSVGNQVTVDQGYLLVEDLRPKFDVRRFQTLKQVFLTEPIVVVGAEDVCGFWSFVSGLIQQGC